MNETEPSGNSQSVDLTNCDREPIHALGRVQSYGALLAVSSDWVILHASENISAFLGCSADDIIGTAAVDVLTGGLLHDIRAQLQLLTSPDSVERIFHHDLPGRDHPVEIAVHRSGHIYIIEFENSDVSGPKDYMSVVRPLIDRLTSADTMEALYQRAARQLHALIGFDRIMVYRFCEDESGEVVGEDLRPGMEPFLGLRYPTSDIPKQARALYTRSLLRIISDVNDAGYAIVPQVTPEGEALDLSISSTRAVSPIH